MDRGRIVERGTFRELAAADGLFARWSPRAASPSRARATRRYEAPAPTRARTSAASRTRSGSCSPSASRLSTVLSR